MPGPGYYENPERALDKIKSRSPSVIFYEETRAEWHWLIWIKLNEWKKLRFQMPNKNKKV